MTVNVPVSADILEEDMIASPLFTFLTPSKHNKDAVE
jgi:hypothetical protein